MIDDVGARGQRRRSASAAGQRRPAAAPAGAAAAHRVKNPSSSIARRPWRPAAPAGRAGAAWPAATLAQAGRRWRRGDQRRDLALAVSALAEPHPARVRLLTTLMSAVAVDRLGRAAAARDLLAAADDRVGAGELVDARPDARACGRSAGRKARLRGEPVADGRGAPAACGRAERARGRAPRRARPAGPRRRRRASPRTPVPSPGGRDAGRASSASTRRRSTSGPPRSSS